MCADARDFELEQRDFALCLVAMQTVQLLGGAGERLRALKCARAHLRPGGLLACAILAAIEPFDCAQGDQGPPPETARIDGALYVSRPLRVARAGGSVLIERERQIITSPQAAHAGRREARPGARRVLAVLDRLSAARLEREGAQAGLRPERARAVRADRRSRRQHGGDAACLTRPAQAGVPPPLQPLRVCALYPDLMNIYADRGNLLVLERRCAWRGIGFELHASGLGERLDADAHDLFYLGGGQDRDQRLCAVDLLETKRRGAARRGGTRGGRARRMRRLPAARPLLRARRGGDRRRRAARRAHGARGRPAADRQRRDRGRRRGRRSAPVGVSARRLREPRRAHPARARASSRSGGC